MTTADDEMIGRTFGKLKVLERSRTQPSDKFRKAVYTCECSCGRIICPGKIDATAIHLRQGKATDCWYLFRKSNPADNYEPPAPVTPEELKNYRDQHHWNTRHFAARTGYDQMRLIHCENGTQDIPKTLNILVRLMQDKERLEAELAAARGES